MKKKILLTAVAAAAIAVSAQAQVRYLKADQPYTFTGTTATGTGTITYQWYRNGQPIANATSASYTMPAGLASGADVEVKRGVMSSTCSNNISYTNRFVITFVSCMTVGSVCWAEANVDAYQTFAPRPDMYTMFYQWDRSAAWPATGSISGWNNTANTTTTWSVNPCPTDWRLPTSTEFTALHNAGTTWVNAGIRGAAVSGRFYGPNHATAASCTLPNNMTNCVFLPAAGGRYGSDGEANNYTECCGNYWSSTQNSSTTGYSLDFTSSSSNPSRNNDKSYAFAIRCVMQ